MTRVKRYPVAPAPERIDQALEAGAAEWRHAFGVDYLRVRSDHRNVPRGVVRVRERVVPAYPSVARIFALAAGIAGSFEGTFYAEEKIDGYNVRIFDAGGRPLAITRSGMACPFTNDRLPDLIAPEALRALFADHPELILCAEVAGRGNPYMPTLVDRWGDDVQLFVFDLMRSGSQAFVPVLERDQLLRRYDIPQPPQLGPFELAELSRLGEEILRLDREGAEGVVLKPPAEGPRVKYVTPTINLTDIISDAALEMELPGEFFTHRIVRMVMALRELDQRERLPELAGKLGEALVLGFDEALNEVERSGQVARSFRVRLRAEASCDALLEHIGGRSRTVDLQEVSRRQVGEHWELTFRKVFRKSSDRLKTLLSGGPVFD